MQLFASKNGDATQKKATNGTSLPKSDIVLKSVITSVDGKYSVNTNFHFNGCFKPLELENNGIALAMSASGKVIFVVLPDTDKNCLLFNKTEKNSNGKSKFIKVTNLVKALETQGLVGSPDSEKIKSNTIFSQYLSLAKVENEENTLEGTIATYEVISAGIEATYTDVREVSDEVKAKIKAGRAATAAAKV